MRNATIAILLLLGVTWNGAAQQEGSSEDGSDPALVEKIQELGGRVMRVAADDPAVEIAFHLGRSQDGLRQVDATDSEGPESPALDGELGILKDLGRLVSLHLGGTDVTDEGLVHLAGLTALKRLHLEKTRVSDAGLEHLAGLESLTYLNLYLTGVTDAGLAHLEGLKNLKSLYLWQTQVTPEGAEKLRQVLPDCHVDLGWKAPEEPEQAEEAEEQPPAEN